MTPVAEPRIIVGLNGSNGDPHVVRTAMELARALDTVLYAVDVQGGGRPTTGDRQSPRRQPPRMQDAYYALSKAGGLPDDVDVRIVVVDGDPGGQLVRLASRPTDLLVVERGGRVHDEKSTIAWDCVARATCPVLVVPPPPPTPDHAEGPSREDATVAS